MTFFTIQVEIKDHEKSGSGSVTELRMLEDVNDSPFPEDESPTDKELLNFVNSHLPDRFEATAVIDFAH